MLVYLYMHIHHDIKQEFHTYFDERTFYILRPMMVALFLHHKNLLLSFHKDIQDQNHLYPNSLVRTCF